MTPRDRFTDLAPEEFDRRLAAWFEADARTRDPEGLLEATLTRIGRTRRLPAWLLPERWLPMQLTSRLQPVPSIAGVLLVLGLILALAVAAVLIGSQRQRLDPFGPAANGRIAFVSEGDIYGQQPDGTDPVAVTSGADHRWTARLVARRLEGRFPAVVVVAASTADLMVLDIDAGTLVPVAEGAVNASVPSWSPDDRLLTFSATLNRSRSTLPPPMAPPTREHRVWWPGGGAELRARMAGGSPTQPPPPVGRRSSSSTSTGRDAHGSRRPTPASPTASPTEAGSGGARTGRRSCSPQATRDDGSSTCTWSLQTGRRRNEPSRPTR